MTDDRRQHSGPALRRAKGAFAVLVLVALGGWLPAAEPTTEAVSLVIDYGDGAQVHFTALRCSKGMTVVDALSAAQKHPHGVKFAQRGRGATALVTQIGDLKNEGNGKNWIYSVNGKTAEVGAGAYKLEPGDRVLWEFKRYE